MATHATCDNCGREMAINATGRPRRWCSDACRSKANRRAVPPLETDDEAAIRVVLDSPDATRRLLKDLAARIANGECAGREYNGVIAAAIGVYRAIIDRVSAANGVNIGGAAKPPPEDRHRR